MESIEKPIFIFLSQIELESIFEHNHILSHSQGFDFFDKIVTNHVRAVNANENFGI